MTTNYAAEGHPELDEACAIEPRYARRFDALTYEQRHNITLAIESEQTTFMNEQYAGKETTFASIEDATSAAAEGQLTEEEGQ